MKFQEGLQLNTSTKEEVSTPAQNLNLEKVSGIEVSKEITLDQRKDFVRKILNKETIVAALKESGASFDEGQVSFMADLLDLFTRQKGTSSMMEGLSKINNDPSLSENEKKAIALVLSTQVDSISDFFHPGMEGGN